MNDIDRLERRCERLERVLGQTIQWIAQSAVGVLSHNDAQVLIEELRRNGGCERSEDGD